MGGRGRLDDARDRETERGRLVWRRGCARSLTVILQEGRANKKAAEALEVEILGEAVRATEVRPMPLKLVLHGPRKLQEASADEFKPTTGKARKGKKAAAVSTLFSRIER